MYLDVLSNFSSMTFLKIVALNSKNWCPAKLQLTRILFQTAEVNLFERENEIISRFPIYINLFSLF